MTYPTYIRDLIYFDEGKAASIFSQLRQGLIQEIQSSSEKTSKTSDTLKANLGLIGGASSEEGATRVGQLESRILHHSLLDELERDLDATGLVFDITRLNTTDLDQVDLRRRLDSAA